MPECPTHELNILTKTVVTMISIWTISGLALRATGLHQYPRSLQHISILIYLTAAMPVGAVGDLCRLTCPRGRVEDTRRVLNANSKAHTIHHLE